MVRAGGSASRTISDNNSLTQVGVVVRLGNNRKMTLMDPDGPRMYRASQFWGALLRQKRTAAIVQYRSVQRWWIKMQNWTLSVVQRGVGSHRAPLGRLTKANAAGRERWVNTTDDVSQKKQRRNEIRRTAYIGGGGGFLSGAAQARNEEAGRKTKSSRTGGISPTAVVKPPLPTAGGVM